MQQTFFSSLNKTRGILAALMICVLLLPACASRGGKTYSDGEVRQAQNVSYGTVVSVDQVQVAEDPSGLGTILGGVAGGVLGSLVGGGRGRTLAILGGAAGGAVAGTAIEGEARKYSAAEITVELDNGKTVVIVQGNDEYFTKGDKVRIVTTGQNKARVQHAG